jgi:hypothetical protein
MGATLEPYNGNSKMDAASCVNRRKRKKNLFFKELKIILLSCEIYVTFDLMTITNGSLETDLTTARPLMPTPKRREIPPPPTAISRSTLSEFGHN